MNDQYLRSASYRSDNRSNSREPRYSPSLEHGHFRGDDYFDSTSRDSAYYLTIDRDFVLDDGFRGGHLRSGLADEDRIKA